MRRALIAALCVLALPMAAEAQEATTSKIRYKADKVTYDKQAAYAVLEGHVQVTVKDVVITGEKVEIDFNKRLIKTDQAFHLEQAKDNQKTVVDGGSFSYAIDIERAEFNNARLVMPAPQGKGQFIFLSGESILVYQGGKRLVAEGALFTTCDNASAEALRRGNLLLDTVHYSLKAGTIDFIPDDRVIAWNTVVNVMQGRTFWFPVWYVPLRRDSLQGIEVGQNAAEGFYTRFRVPYSLNERHYGTHFHSLMEKKGYGLGVEHTWDNRPHSLSELFMWGIPYNDPFGRERQALEAGQAAAPTLAASPATPPTYFRDYDLGLKHKQLLTPTMEAEGAFFDRNRYTITGAAGTGFENFLPQRENEQILRFNFSDRESFAVGDELPANLDVTASTDLARQWNRDPRVFERGDPLSTAQNYTLRLGSRVGPATTTLESNFQDTRQSAPALAGASPVPSNVTTNWQNRLTHNQELLPGLNLSTSHNLWRRTTPNPAQPEDQQLDSTLSLSQALGFATVKLDTQKRFDFTVLPSGLTREQRLRQGNFIDKLPELTITSQPLLQEWVPLTLTLGAGRFFESASLTEAARFNLEGTVNAKPIDLGLGMQVDFGGTGYQQRFYTTQDAQYALTGAGRWTNNLFPWLLPEVRYRHTLVGDEGQLPFRNNSPFVFDKLSFSKAQQLDYSLALVNQPKFTWRLRSGYDYLRQRYQDLDTSMSSRIGDVLDLQLQTRYSFKEVRKEDVGKEVQFGDETRVVKPEDVGALHIKGGRWHPVSLRATYQPFGPFGGDFGLEEGIRQGLLISGNVSFDFTTNQIAFLEHEVAFSVGTAWWAHTEVSLNSVYDLSRRTYEPFNRISVQKDLHDFVLAFSYDRLSQQFLLHMTMPAFGP